MERPAADVPDVASRLESLGRLLLEEAETPREGVDAERFGAALKKVAARVGAIPPRDFDAVEEELAAAEAALHKALRPSLGEALGRDLDERVEALLEGTSPLSSAARGRLKKALERREMRRLLGLPSLTLFEV